MANKYQSGGKREGPGRPPLNPEGITVAVTFTVPAALVDQLGSKAKQHNWTRSQAATEAIRAFVAPPNRV